jgi:hypothetical protein
LHHGLKLYDDIILYAIDNDQNYVFTWLYFSVKIINKYGSLTIINRAAEVGAVKVLDYMYERMKYDHNVDISFIGLINGAIRNNKLEVLKYLYKIKIPMQIDMFWMRDILINNRLIDIIVWLIQINNKPILYELIHLNRLDLLQKIVTKDPNIRFTSNDLVYAISDNKINIVIWFKSFGISWPHDSISIARNNSHPEMLEYLDNLEDVPYSKASGVKYESD